MTRHSLRIPWAGPAVAAALLFAAFTPRPAHTAPAAPVALLPAAQIDQGYCINEAVAFIGAINEWLSAWQSYQTALPGGTATEIQSAVDRLNQATTQVLHTGVKFLLCLMKFMD